MTVDWIAAIAGIGGLVTGTISLAVTLREKQRTLKVALQWGINPTHQKTSGIVLLITIANIGYQPVTLNGARLLVRGVTEALTAVKPWTNKQFPTNLQPGGTFATSISSEVLLDMLRASAYRGRIPMRAVVETVFKDFKSSRVALNISRLEEMVAFVKVSTGYGQFKEFITPMGSIGMKSFDLIGLSPAASRRDFNPCGEAVGGVRHASCVHCRVLPVVREEVGRTFCTAPSTSSYGVPWNVVPTGKSRNPSWTRCAPLERRSLSSSHAAMESTSSGFGQNLRALT